MCACVRVSVSESECVCECVFVFALFQWNEIRIILSFMVVHLNSVA